MPDPQVGPPTRGFENGGGGLNGPGNRAIGPSWRPASGTAQKARPNPLDGRASAELRDNLVAEIHALGSSDEATAWAQRRMADKNRLSAADARKIEEAFQHRIFSFSTRVRAVRANGSRKSARARQGASIDKSALAFPEPRRVRDRDHVRSVAQRPCLVCGRQPSDSHHLRFAKAGQWDERSVTSSRFRCVGATIANCIGDEATWWRKQGIDPTGAARSLWLESHPLPSTGSGVGSKPPDTGDSKRADLRNEANREPRR
jgi:hypothetical protein